ncbi:type II toxin-antitoxin system ParD family antitoxin [Pseudomonas sp. NFXW11]|uniref:type II toxin-antitoxin system ParD family antitoxin n=1 Tax=Pseudomonas sp. NFXW11 TaxID=2819531 RepID=UPI003CF2E0D4
MPTRDLVLTPHQLQFIARLIESGRYQNASEVMGEGLRLLQQRMAEHAMKITALRQAAVMGLEDLQQGRCDQVPAANLQHYLNDLGLEALTGTREKH